MTSPVFASVRRMKKSRTRPFISGGTISPASSAARIAKTTQPAIEASLRGASAGS
jgi:hypothetical protein